MCGLSGLWRPHGDNAERLLADVGCMAGELSHRGPDAHGEWADPAAGLALGHTRLSILDLSEKGSQPMSSPCGRYVLAYNGEVYNFVPLRRELEAAGWRFRGGSDSEVVLAALATWGPARALPRFVGMFALAFWDSQERRLVLARDRLGIKPLFWALNAGALAFGSELKAIRRFPGFQARLDRSAIALFLRFGYVPSPHCIYCGVRKLRPGTWAEFLKPGEPAIHTWWSARDVARAGRMDPVQTSLPETLDRLEESLRTAVRARLVADVPVGAFLSGGVDSSLVAALMQEASKEPVRTFTVGFEEDGFDEAGHARRVARHIGTRHHEYTVTSLEAQELIPALPQTWDEPFADPSQIPTWWVSRFAAKHVKVCLSGDGGDELFGGYSRYKLATRIHAACRWIPRPLRTGISGALRAVPSSSWNALARAAGPLAPATLAPGKAGHRVRRLAEVLAMSSPDAVYEDLVSHWKQPAGLIPGVAEPQTVHAEGREAGGLPGFLERMMYKDTVSYLPDDILTKVDRASMAEGLEARTPLLDHRLVKFAWRIPAAERAGNGPGKAMLRGILYRHVPRHLVDRPKMGFGVPIGKWLRGPLREWAENLLEPGRLGQDGILAPEPVRAIWQEHLSGSRNWEYRLWDVLMLQAWKEHWL